MSIRRLAACVGVAVSLFVGFLFVIPACACLPVEYREVPAESLPESSRKLAAEGRPGFRPERAWLRGHRLGQPGELRTGYTIRGRRPGDWWSTDVRVAAPPLPEVQPELRPLDPAE